MDLQTRAQYMIRKQSLYNERSSWFSHWREISEVLCPRQGRFFLADRNRGGPRHTSIINDTGTDSLGVLAAGLMAGMTSPARPWFRLATSDTEMMEYEPVKVWLDKVTILMRDIFARSNTYRALHSLYEEIGAVGTGANLMDSNFKNVIHNSPMTTGEYAISTNDLGEVDTFVREMDMTVAQMVGKFGKENCSTLVQNLYSNGTGFDQWVSVTHLIEPRGLRDYSKIDNKNMPFKSCYFESGTNEDKFLRESGFKRFPGLCPRWAVSGGDIYGNSPGMRALGGIKSLQHDELRKMQGVDYKVKPPLQIPTALKDQPHSTLPGGSAYFDMTGNQNAIRSMFAVDIDLSHLQGNIQQVEHRIQRAFYVPLFLMLANDQRSGITAREIVERHEEKLLMLGPVLERLHNELLTPLIDITFDKMVEAGIVPEPPEELQGQDLNVQFVSMLAQAQRAIGTQSVDRLRGTVGSIAVLQANAGQEVTALDKLDLDQIIDGYSEMLGTDPNFIVADDKVAIIRDQRVKARQQAQQQAAMQQAVETAKTASETDTSGENALTNALGQFSGYSVPGTL
jgi:hypothetical protein